MVFLLWELLKKETLQELVDRKLVDSKSLQKLVQKRLVSEETFGEIKKLMEERRAVDL